MLFVADRPLGAICAPTIKIDAIPIPITESFSYDLNSKCMNHVLTEYAFLTREK